MPIDRGVIDQQLQSLRESAGWWDKREFRDLPAVLNAGEHILAISRGKLGRPRWLRRSWLIVVTDRRLLCLRSSDRTGWRQLEVSADEIERVALRVGLFRGRLLVVAGGHTYRLLVPRLDAYKLNTALSSLGTPSNEAFFGFAPTRMVRRMIDHVFALPAAALNQEPQRRLPERLAAPTPDPRVESLQEQVQQLREQVDFLEQLLRQRQALPNPDETLRSG